MNAEIPRTKKSKPVTFPMSMVILVILVSVPRNSFCQRTNLSYHLAFKDAIPIPNIIILITKYESVSEFINF